MNTVIVIKETHKGSVLENTKLPATEIIQLSGKVQSPQNLLRSRSLSYCNKITKLTLIFLFFTKTSLLRLDKRAMMFLNRSSEASL